MRARPVIYVLAGVNGAGKSSVGGYLLQQAGMDWFNPDEFARDLVAETGMENVAANAAAWREGLRRLEAAMSESTHFAFETTLAGRTIPARLRSASATHDILVWFCGLASPDLHVARVRARVVAGGHDIPERKIRERYPTALANLIALMPCLAHLRVYDNSVGVDVGMAIPDPVLVAEMEAGRLIWPGDAGALRRTPEWAKPLLEAAMVLSE